MATRVAVASLVAVDAQEQVDDTRAKIARVTVLALAGVLERVPRGDSGLHGHRATQRTDIAAEKRERRTVTPRTSFREVSVQHDLSMFTSRATLDRSGTSISDKAPRHNSCRWQVW